jgi:site-specific DNA-methyltransferase (cytosine-N4-specific)
MKPYFSQHDVTLYHGDCREVMRSLPAASVHCCVTSPPYWGLRDYGTATWEGGDAGCDHTMPNKNDRKFKNGRGELDGFSGKSLTSWTHRDAMPSSGVCPRCGARRIDQQLGLEATPDCGRRGLISLRDDLTTNERVMVMTRLHELGLL